MLKHLSDYLGQIVDLPPRLDVLRRAGLLDPVRPDEGIRSILAVRRLGPIAGAARIAARRDPRALAVVDELGPLTFGELDRRSNALARAWSEHGLGPASVIAVLCRDHRWLVDCMLASAKLGARLLLMNTGFSRPQLADVAERERVSALTYDQEFTELLGAVRTDIPRYLAWSDTPAETGPDIVKLADLIAGTCDKPVPTPSSAGHVVLLTSGTTGTPKGARAAGPLAAGRDPPAGADSAAPGRRCSSRRRCSTPPGSPS